MLYITTRCETLPRNQRSATSDAVPMSTIPLLVVSRSERAAKRCGTHESFAMLANTRGPSRKPACAATTSSAPSATSVAQTKAWPSGDSPAKRDASTAFIVSPGTCSTRQSR